MANFFSATQQPSAQSTNTLQNAATNVAAAAANSAGVTVRQTDDTPPAPLEAFKGMWDIDATKAGVKPTGVLPVVTAEQLTTTLANSNFLSNVNPELMAKAAGGDAAAFQDVMNQGLRTVMAQSVLASHGLVEAGARGANEQLRTTIPTMVRSSNVQDSLQANPLFSNPQAKPMVDMVRSQLESKHPQASAREIADMTQAFVTDFAKLATPETAAQAGKGKTAAGDTDWYAMLGLN
jgi:hypothetical protein